MPPTPFLFNNIPAFRLYLIYFLEDSSFAQGFGKPILCFHRHSRFVPSFFKVTAVPSFPVGGDMLS